MLFTGRLSEIAEIATLLVDRQRAFDADEHDRLSAQRLGMVTAFHTRRSDSRMGVDSSLRVLVSSYGGAGKTQLMLKYAWEQREYYTGGIFWVEASWSTVEAPLRCAVIPFHLHCVAP
jgi:hypothetical protein